MIKTLKFSDNLVPLILSDEKNITWRLFDEKDLNVGDPVIFLKYSDQKPFAKAKLISVEEKKMSELNEKDFDGHEKFNSSEEMYKTYSEYYRTAVDENTLVKVIKFSLLDATIMN